MRDACSRSSSPIRYAQKSTARYATVGLSDKANLDKGLHVAHRFRAKGTDCR